MSTLNMDGYLRKGTVIKEELRRLKDAIHKVYPGDREEEIMEIIRRFNEDQFRLVVLGEFSRGKSTFINGMLGKKILPSSAVPTTTVINKIKYNESPEYMIEFHDASIPNKLITEEEFKNIKAVPKPLAGDIEKEQVYEERMKEISSIKFALVGHPLPLLQNNVEIIDTPGLNDIEEMRARITQEFVPQSDAAIFVLSAKKILAESEMNFLEWIQREDIQRIFFVINHADVLKTDEARQKIFNYAYDKLKDKFPNVIIHMISSKIALDARRIQNGEDVKVKGKVHPLSESGFLEFEDALSSFLVNERGVAKMEKPVAGGIRIINEVVHKIMIEQNTLYKDVKILEQQMETLRPELHQFRNSIETIRHSYETMISNGKQELIRFLQLGLEAISSTAVRAVQSYEGELNGEAIQRAVEVEVVPMQSRLQSEMRRRQQAIIDNALQQAHNRYTREWGKVETALSTALTTTDQPFQFSSDTGYSVYETGLDPLEDESMKKGIAAVGAGLIGLNVIGSVGLAGLLFAPILLPVAFIGIGGLLNSFFKEGNRQRLIAKVRAQVEDRYRGQIPAVLREFEQKWDASAEAAAERFFLEATMRVTSIEEQLSSILESKRTEEEKAAGREQLLKGAEKTLSTISVNLRNVIEGREVSLV